MDRDDWTGAPADWDEAREDEREFEGGFTAAPARELVREARDAGRRVSRAPRDYRRSDERIREDIYERLCGETGADASDVSVSVHEGDVTLVGTVPDREDKRRVELVAEHVRGVRDVFNRLRVQAGAH